MTHDAKPSRPYTRRLRLAHSAGKPTKPRVAAGTLHDLAELLRIVRWHAAAACNLTADLVDALPTNPTARRANDFAANVDRLLMAAALRFAAGLTAAGIMPPVYDVPPDWRGEGVYPK